MPTRPCIDPNKAGEDGGFCPNVNPEMPAPLGMALHCEQTRMARRASTGCNFSMAQLVPNCGTQFCKMTHWGTRAASCPPLLPALRSLSTTKKLRRHLGARMRQAAKARDILPHAAVQTVPETLECELYDGRADDEIATYQPQHSAVVEEDSNEGFVQSRQAVEQVPNNNFVKEEEMEAELTNKEVSLLVVNEREDNLVVADSEESPSLLQQDKVTRLASPREIWDIDEDAPSNALSTVTPAREMPCRRPAVCSG
ncbi:hypothetical protein HPB51_024508 [Rhipicephalus microplus]|uniref:Uncharacterized protein n=1 Tax=Rhipicephalus microplus TaxID=6941 RepID=A0A9J6DXA7_RHIMP|nr:hypothetical protein HPB51_024508 [Rhipicephalus microplus]